MEFTSQTMQSNQSLSNIIVETNDRLNEVGVESADRAFNLGCSIGLIPAIAIVVLTFFLMDRSWAASAIVALLMVIGLLGLANLAANISRANAINRVYTREVLPEIESFLNEFNLPREELDKLVNEELPDNAPLRIFVPTLQKPGNEESN